MSPGIRLQHTLSRTILVESDEAQLLYILIEVASEGLPARLPKLPLNVCLVIDRSSSMRGERLNQVKEAARNIVEQLSQDDYFSLVTFNDRAEVVVQAQRVIQKNELKNAIGMIEPAGGTEMATGMALALQEIQRPLAARGVNRILLLTDGRTYGDESRCVEIARRAQSRSIGLTALGVGTEWNEDLLETMTARENSRAHYITSTQEVGAVFAEELKRMGSVFAQQVRLRIATRPDALVRSMDQVQPFIAPISIIEEADKQWSGGLGDWTGNDTQAFLVEVVVPPLPSGDHPLMKLSLHYHLPSTNLRDQTSELIIRVSVREASEAPAHVDPNVKHWLERIMAYRLQLDAWRDVEAGRIETATQRLKMASTRLFSAGEVALAQTVEEEATRLLRSGNASEEGRKRIRFGTRGLMGSGLPGEQETNV